MDREAKIIIGMMLFVFWFLFPTVMIIHYKAVCNFVHTLKVNGLEQNYRLHTKIFVDYLGRW